MLTCTLDGIYISDLGLILTHRSQNNRAITKKFTVDGSCFDRGKLVADKIYYLRFVARSQTDGLHFWRTSTIMGLPQASASELPGPRIRAFHLDSA
jgi:hypothetical protein